MKAKEPNMPMSQGNSQGSLRRFTPGGKGCVPKLVMASTDAVRSWRCLPSRRTSILWVDSEEGHREMRISGPRAASGKDEQLPEEWAEWAALLLRLRWVG